MSVISSLCRTCTANVVNTTEEDVYSCNIFETEGLAEKLMLCSNIDIQPCDEYPPHVCNTCCINILDFCDFQEMCRESLEKFNKMLEKQTTTEDDSSVEVSKDRLTNTIDIESESNHEIILGDHSNDKQEDIIEIKSDPESDEEADNGPLTGTKDCVIVEEINIARRETMEKIINCEHDYGQSGEAAVSRPLVGGSDGSEDERGDDSGRVTDYEDDRGLGYNNMFKIICSVDETLLNLNPVSTELNLNMLKNVSPDDNDEIKDGSSKTENGCVSIGEDTYEDVVLFEDFHVTEEDLSEGKEDKKTQLENGDGDFEEECIFEELSDDEWGYKKRLKHDSEDEANEDYLFASPSEDEEIYSDSDTVLSDSKPKTVKYHNFSCDLCPQTFILEQRLIAHKRRHQGLHGYPCSRENCTRSYNRLIDLRQHLRDHDGIPRHIYKCILNNCGLTYTTKSGLHMHLRKYHNRAPALSARKYVCETCGKVYQHAHGLRVHQYIHVDESLWPFKCDIDGCSKKFRSNSYYKIHKNRHNGIKPFACTYCGKRFCSYPNLNVHINFHTLEKKWTCNFCPKIFYTPANLRLHIRIKHENNPDAKNFPCRFCNKILSTYTARKCHERRHTGEKSFVCEECCRSFKRACDLRMHKQTHMPRGPPKVRETVKSFYCSVCNKALANAINLKHHEMKHTEGKQFACDICGVKFSYQRNLHRHQQQNLCRKFKTTKDKYPAEEGSIEVLIMDKNVHINVEDM